MKTYITFGQIHAHSINGKTVDKDCVAVINAETYKKGRDLAMSWFNGEFHNSYPEDYFNVRKEEIMEYYPRGLIEVN